MFSPTALAKTTMWWAVMLVFALGIQSLDGAITQTPSLSPSVSGQPSTVLSMPPTGYISHNDYEEYFWIQMYISAPGLVDKLSDLQQYDLRFAASSYLFAKVYDSFNQNSNNCASINDLYFPRIDRQTYSMSGRAKWDSGSDELYHLSVIFVASSFYSEVVEGCLGRTFASEVERVIKNQGDDPELLSLVAQIPGLESATMVTWGPVTEFYGGSTLPTATPVPSSQPSFITPPPYATSTPSVKSSHSPSRSPELIPTSMITSSPSKTATTPPPSTTTVTHSPTKDTLAQTKEPSKQPTSAPSEAKFQRISLEPTVAPTRQPAGFIEGTVALAGAIASSLMNC